MLHILTCPDSVYASQRLCRRLIEDSLELSDGRFIAIVPEQATLQMQRSVVEAHPRHAVMNIDIVSFDRLAHKVFDELGYAGQSVLNDTGKILILRKVLEECREDLVMYRNKVRMPGFAEQIKSAITELRQYTLDDNDLYLMQQSAQREGNQVLYNKLQDIRVISRRFQRAIADRYTTQEEVLSVLARLVKSSGMLQGAFIYLDGFTGFTPIQYRLIQELLTCAAEVTVTVTLPRKDAIFSLSQKTLEKLQELAEEQSVPCRIQRDEVSPPVPKAFRYDAPDIRSEIVFIASRILQGVRNEGKRFRDYAVVLSDMEAYHRVVEEVFTEAGIPCFLDHKKKLGDNVLARFVISALQVVMERFSFDSVFACLKCQVLDVPLRQIQELENYCLAFGIREASAWRKDFTRNRKTRKGSKEQEPSESWDLKEINRIRQAAGGDLLEFFGSCSGKGRTAGDYSDALERLLERTGAQKRMEELSQRFQEAGDTSRAKEYEQIFRQIQELLEQIRDLMGGEPISIREYREILAGAMEEVKVGIIPPTLDAVAVGDLIRSRMGRPGTLFLAGVNEGKLPSKASGGGLFTAPERSFLKRERFELAPDALEDLYTQYFYLYLLFTKPREALYLSCALRGFEGEEQLPSCILQSLDDILPGLCLTQADGQETALWKNLGADRLAAAVRRERDMRTGWSEQETALLRFFARHGKTQLDQILAGALFSNRPLELDEQTVLDLYGDVLMGSVSRYERFYECPFRHFLDYGLALQKRWEYEVQAADIGTAYHESLERYSLKLKENGWTFRDVTDQDSDLLAREAAQEAAAQMPGDILHSSERNRYLLERMIRITQKTADVLRHQVRQGMYDPARYELEFARRSQDQTMLLGKIDRVDLYEEGDIFVKIIDYKSGKKRFSVRDIYSGIQLQLTAYLQEAMAKVQEAHPDQNVRPGGIYYYLIQDRYLRPEEDAAEKYRMSGFTNSDEQALRAIDTQAGPGGDVQRSVIAEINYTKKGLTSASKVASDGEFAHLIGFVEERITQAARRIRSGDTAIHPYCDGSARSACNYCDYRSVCKFEPGKWGSDERRLPEVLTESAIREDVFGQA